MPKYVLPQEFVVKRSSWLRGEGSGPSYLLRPDDQKMCCIGFLAESCGIPRDRLVLERGLSDAFPQDLKEIDSGLLSFSDFLRRDCAVYMTNDDPRIPDAEREERLTAMFLSQGIEVRFVDE